MASIRPFQALRYNPTVAGPLDKLVAPPYDVISDPEREELRARSPYNIVHLTLPDSEEQAAQTISQWRDEQALVLDERPSVSVIEQDYVGPDGIARMRTGLAASVRAEPYDRGTILPHERTHRGPKEGRLRLLRAARTHLEPIFLLYDGPPPVTRPDRAPDVEVEGTRVWRVEQPEGLEEALADRQQLIADGHHRYETTLAFHEAEGTPESAWLLAVLVSTDDPGLTIFPTHRVFTHRPESLDALPVEVVASGDLQEALTALDKLDFDQPAAVRYTKGRAEVVVGPAGELDVELVDRLGHEAISYTPQVEEAAGAVESGEAEIAFLLRPTRIEDIFGVARRGKVMPQKSTYFYPKLISGLMLHPL